jgi:nicotinamide-nucleotide amidase
VARRITSVPGASLRFAGGAVCYTDAAKVALAGVEPGTLASEGAVSAAIGLQMAEGIRRRLGAEWGLATTGYAGPDAGGPDRPVGTVILALAGPGVSVTREARFPGQRTTIQDRAAQAALDLLRRGLLGSIT